MPDEEKEARFISALRDAKEPIKMSDLLKRLGLPSREMWPRDIFWSLFGDRKVNLTPKRRITLNPNPPPLTPDTLAA